MDAEEPRFEVMSIEEMRKKYYSPDEKPPVIVLDPSNVPEALRPLIPLAERWGISDDILRWDARERASAEEIASLEKTVAQFDDALDAWLAGPEAKGPTQSREYLAFSNMRMAADGC